MIKILFFSTIVLFSSLGAGAQYYYKDIFTNRELLAEMAKLKENKFRTVKLNSFDRPEEPSLGFFCEKRINRDYTEMEVSTQAYSVAPSELISNFNKNGQLQMTVDSSEIFVNTTTYSYNADGLISSILSQSVSKDEDETNDAKEEHLYIYNGKQLQKMIKVKNGKDSTTYLFTADERGNIIEEKDSKTGKTYYYYYDSKNRLTDVVYYSDSYRRLLPIIMYDYNPAGNITQMVTTDEGSTFYYTWRYTYNDGLKVTEKCYQTKQKEPFLRDNFNPNATRQLMGIIEYEYK